MERHHPTPGYAELRAACFENRGLWASVAVFSVFGNLVMLAGPLSMLQLYDRVLGSGSVETLVALTLLVVFLYAVMGVLDLARGRIMGREDARLRGPWESWRRAVPKRSSDPPKLRSRCWNRRRAKGRRQSRNCAIYPASGDPAGGAALLPGTPVDAFIGTQAQRPITYLLAPFSRYFARAFRE